MANSKLSRGSSDEPPLAEKLFQLARAGNIPKAQRSEMHVGSLDWLCDSGRVCALGALIGVPATVVAVAGHLLGSQYIGKVLDL